MTLMTRFPIGQALPGYDISVSPEVVEGVVVYVARHPSLPRVYSQGATPDEAVADLAEVREAYLADMRAMGEPVPDPVSSPSIQRLVLASEPLPSPPNIRWTVKVQG